MEGKTKLSATDVFTLLTVIGVFAGMGLGFKSFGDLVELIDLQNRFFERQLDTRTKATERSIDALTRRVEALERKP